MVKGFKAFKKDKGGYYTDGVGRGEKTYWKIGDRKSISELPVLCEKGFHYFEHLCFAINYLEDNNMIGEVEVYGDIKKDTFKVVTNDIKFVRIIPKKEIKKLVDGNCNAGDCNAGNWNAGNRNAGNWNAGNWNAGNGNAGNWNAGDGNAGNWNAGNWNAGNRNVGDGNAGNGNAGNWNVGDGNAGNWNAGDGNAGNWNAGDGNAGNWNAGNRNVGDGNAGNGNVGDGNAGNWNLSNGYKNYFSTKDRYFIFDVEVKEIPESLKFLDMYWFNLEGKTHEDYKKAWSKCPQRILDILKSIPQFKLSKNKRNFKKITGISL